MTSKYRTQLAYDTGGGPYRVVREGVEVQAVVDLYSLKRANAAQIAMTKRQIADLHDELTRLLAEEKRLLDRLMEVAGC